MASIFAGLLLVVLADELLIGDDPKRSLDAYLALKMRIWADVRPEGRDNPLAPLVRLADQSSCWFGASDGSAVSGHVAIGARSAIEALRAGVPNRAAIQLLGTNETALSR